MHVIVILLASDSSSAVITKFIVLPGTTSIIMEPPEDCTERARSVLLLFVKPYRIEKALWGIGVEKVQLPELWTKNSLPMIGKREPSPNSATTIWISREASSSGLQITRLPRQAVSRIRISSIS